MSSVNDDWLIQREELKVKRQVDAKKADDDTTENVYRLDEQHEQVYKHLMHLLKKSKFYL